MTDPVAAHAGQGRILIARFSRGAFAWSSLVWLLFFSVYLFCCHELFLGPHPETRRAVGDAFFFILGSPILAWCVVAGARLLRIAAINRWEALWLESGRLIYADKKRLDVEVSDILAVTLFYNSGQLLFRKMNPELWFDLKSGKTAVLRLKPLAGPPGDIIASLEARLGLTIRERPPVKPFHGNPR